MWFFMQESIETILLRATGAVRLKSQKVLQRLWSGYLLHWSLSVAPYGQGLFKKDLTLASF
jgi:hypothetical protein